AFVAHTDSNFDPVALHRFISDYQEEQVLSIGELWAVAITLRIVLVENLRRLADEIGTGRKARNDADEFANRLQRPEAPRTALELDAAMPSGEPLSDVFAAQLSK